MTLPNNLFYSSSFLSYFNFCSTNNKIANEGLDPPLSKHKPDVFPLHQFANVVF
jgi:hypothetical protein